MDVVFLAGALVFVLGGALFLIDLASARSSGQATGLSRFFAEASVSIPAMLGGAAKYAMWLLASVLNSAFIVLLVTALRTLDRKVGRFTNRRVSRFTPLRKVHHMRRARAAAAAAARSRESQNYLLSPVFR